MFCQAKVDQLQSLLDVVFLYEDQVLRLDVSMNDTHSVKILQDSENLLDYLAGIIFLYMAATALLFANMLLYVVVKLAALVKISDDVVSICIFEPLEYAHDSWMIKLRENLNLCVAFLGNVIEQL